MSYTVSSEILQAPQNGTWPLRSLWACAAVPGCKGVNNTTDNSGKYWFILYGLTNTIYRKFSSEESNLFSRWKQQDLYSHIGSPATFMSWVAKCHLNGKAKGAPAWNLSPSPPLLAVVSSFKELVSTAKEVALSKLPPRPRSAAMGPCSPHYTPRECATLQPLPPAQGGKNSKKNNNNKTNKLHAITEIGLDRANTKILPCAF